MMYELFWPLSAFVVILLMAETLISYLLRCWRISRLRARRHCEKGHSWGKRFGPFSPDAKGDWFWGWKCNRCPVTKTERISRDDSAAHAYFRSNGVQHSEDGWAILQAALDKQVALQEHQRAKSAVDGIISRLAYHPDSWAECDYHLRDKDTGVSLWIANKDYGLKIEAPAKVDLPKDLQQTLYKAIVSWRNRKR